MCRLCAITASFETVPLEVKKALLHEMMLRGSADRQDDGWGITDGLALYRGADSYWKEDPLWYDHLDTNEIWIGHVRSASGGTERSLVASHPYRMRRDWDEQAVTTTNTLFMAAHNGFFQGSWSNYSKQFAQEPNTDSWRAFSKLRELVMKDPFEDITVPAIQEWLNGFEVGSSFCTLILHDEELIVIRGPLTKTLYCATIGDGYLINTSDVILNQTRQYAKRAFGLEVGETITFEENHFGRLLHGDPTWAEYQKLDYTLKTATYTNYSNSQRTYSYTAPVEKGGRWVRLTNEADAVKTTPNKNVELWIQARNYLQPLREGLTEMLAASILGMTDSETGMPWASWRDLTEDQLNQFHLWAKSHAFTSEQRRIINKWNKKVGRNDEIELQWYHFGDTFMWDMPLGLQAVEQLDEFSAVSSDKAPNNFEVLGGD